LALREVKRLFLPRFTSYISGWCPKRTEGDEEWGSFGKEEGRLITTSRERPKREDWEII